MLQARKACKHSDDYIRLNSPSLGGCRLACTQESKDRPGCCEYQVDWKLCIFVPGETAIPSGSLVGAVLRYAGQCNLGMLIDQVNEMFCSMF